MKKRNLVAAALACMMAWALMVGAIATTDDMQVETSEPAQTAAVIEGAGNALDEGMEEAAEFAAETVEKADAEEDAANTEADVRTEAPTETARQQAEGASGRDTYGSDEPTYYEPEPVEAPKPIEEPESSYADEPAEAEEPAPVESAEVEAAAPAESAEITDSTSSEPAESTEVAPVEPVAAPSPVKYRTIIVSGVELSYVDAFYAPSAPWSGAGIWMGSDSTTDGSFGYFIGHNPGDFYMVASIGTGGEVIVHDSSGDSRVYRVTSTFTVPKGSHWSDVSGRVANHGESVILQTCVSEGYRIVVAV